MKSKETIETYFASILRSKKKNSIIQLIISHSN